MNPSFRSVLTLATVAVLAVLSGCAMMMPAAPAKVADGVLTNSAGMTLYTFDRDAVGSGKSACNGACAALWPALMVAGDAKASGDWSIVTRDDGGRQWAYKGKALYLWSKDQKPGDKTGDGFNNVWQVAKE